MINAPLPNSPPRQGIVTFGIAFEAALLAIAAGLAWFLDVSFWQDLRYTLPALAIGVAATLPMLAAVGVITIPDWSITRPLRDVFDMVVKLFRHCTILDLLAISLMAGIGEEALFRGVLQTYAIETTGTVGGVIAASILFGLAHALSGVYALFAFLAGCYFGVLYLYFDNLLVPIIVHALYDFVVLVYAVKLSPASKAINPDS